MTIRDDDKGAQLLTAIMCRLPPVQTERMPVCDCEWDDEEDGDRGDELEGLTIHELVQVTGATDGRQVHQLNIQVTPEATCAMRVEREAKTLRITWSTEAQLNGSMWIAVVDTKARTAICWVETGEPKAEEQTVSVRSERPESGSFLREGLGVAVHMEPTTDD